MIRVAVTGGRDYHEDRRVWEALDRIHDKRPISVLMHGDASGVDAAADWWARCLRSIPCVMAWIAEWQAHGKAAGPIRNRLMLTEGKPDLLVAFPGGKGTASCVAIARELGIEVLVVEEPTRKEAR